MSGSHIWEYDRIYLVSVVIEWYFTILSNACTVSEGELLLFIMNRKK